MAAVRRSRTISGLAVLAVLAALGALVFLGMPEDGVREAGNGTQAQEAGDAARAPLAVTYIEAAAVPIEDVERALATIEAKWSARIAAEVAATVESIAVDVGDEVEEGMLLARLDARDFEIEVARATANMRRIELTIANAERNVERQEQLAGRGHVADAALESAQAELAALRQELAAARSELSRAERNLARTRILAPHAGAVAERLVSEGDYVAAGTVILRIPRSNRLQVRVPVPEAAAGRLAVGMPVRLSTVASDEVVEARISQIQPQVTSSNRTVTAIAEIDNPGGWRPGSSVNAEIVLETRREIALAPTSVVRRPAGNVVYVLDGDVVRERPVTLGRRTQEWVEITKGVAPGERVVVDGAGFMSDGVRVTARPHDAPPPGASVAAGPEPRS